MSALPTRTTVCARQRGAKKTGVNTTDDLNLTVVDNYISTISFFFSVTKRQNEAIGCVTLFLDEENEGGGGDAKIVKRGSVPRSIKLSQNRADQPPVRLLNYVMHLDKMG